MPKSAPIQSSFIGGEFSPFTQARVDVERYKHGLEIAENYIPIKQGPIVRRPGTRYITSTKDDGVARLHAFKFSQTQSFILEFGEEYIRFFTDNGQVESGGNPYEVVTPYQEEDLFELQFLQSADVLYIFHPAWVTYKLTRVADDNWTLTAMYLLDGPYLPLNTTATTITPSATTGTTNFTASAVTGINNGQGFLTTDIGRILALKQSSGWSYARITGRTSTTVVTATILGVAMDASAASIWKLGYFSETTGWPKGGCFHEDRLFLIGGPHAQAINGSVVGDYENFEPYAQDDETVTDENAVQFNLNSTDVNSCEWIMSDEKGLLAGTLASEWLVNGGSRELPITPSSIFAREITFNGSGAVQPIKAGKNVMFVSPAKRKVREIGFDQEVEGFQSPDRTLVADHISLSGLKQLAFQKEPHVIVWAVREDGILVSMTYERDQDNLIIAWARQILGGVSDEDDTPAAVESVAVIPSPDGGHDEVYLIVRRVFGDDFSGYTTKRYVEYIGRYFEDSDEQQDAFFVDAGLTYDNPKTIIGVSSGSPRAVMITAHGFSDGDKVWISGIRGMRLLNNQRYYVRNVTANTFTLEDMEGNAIAGNQYGTYVSGGEARKYVTTITGLEHLEDLPSGANFENSAISVLGDGAVINQQSSVSSGSLTLPQAAHTVHVGIRIRARGKSLRPESGSANGTSIGKTRRVHRLGLFLYRTGGLKIGPSFDDLNYIEFRSTSDEMDTATEVFSGIVSEEFPGDSDFDGQICWEQTDPLPGAILAIMPQMDTQDRQ